MARRSPCFNSISISLTGSRCSRALICPRSIASSRSASPDRIGKAARSTTVSNTGFSFRCSFFLARGSNAVPLASFRSGLSPAILSSHSSRPNAPRAPFLHGLDGLQAIRAGMSDAKRQAVVAKLGFGGIEIYCNELFALSWTARHRTQPRQARDFIDSRWRDLQLQLDFAAHSLTGCGKSLLIGPDIGLQSALRDEMWGASDARLGCEGGSAVQLCELRGAGSKRSSVATDPADCG